MTQIFRSSSARRVVLVLLVLGGLFWWDEKRGENHRRYLQKFVKAKAESLKPQFTEKLPGEEILKNYASISTRPEDDLNAMAHVFANFRLLVKGDAFRMGANEEFAAALLGKNAAKEVFLSTRHACLNAKGQIIDRWGTALFFHVRDRDRVDIRSAGPDREMWTADDLHRLANGEWHRGADLPE